MIEQLDALTEVVGRQHVLTLEDDRRPFSEDVTKNPPGWPDVVVSPGCADEVVAIVRLAARHRCPITPVVANYNVGGLAIPQCGGVVLDLRRLDRILDLDPEAM